MKNRISKIKKIFALSFCGIALFLSIVALVIFISNNNIKKRYLKVEAEVVRLSYSYDSDTSDQVFVKFECEINGEAYKADFTNVENAPSSCYEGEIITIYVNPKTKKAVYVSPMGPFICLGIGLIFLIIGLVFAISLIKSSRKRKFYMRYGDQIWAKIVSYEEIYSTTYNNRHPQKLICEYTGDFCDEIHKFISDPVLLSDPNEVVGSLVLVYVIKQTNMQNYYVDCDNIKKTLDSF